MIEVPWHGFGSYNLLSNSRHAQVINTAQTLLAMGSVCATTTFWKAKAEQVPEASHGHVESAWECHGKSTKKPQTTLWTKE